MLILASNHQETEVELTTSSTLQSDLAPSDYVFGPLKDFLRVKDFNSNEARGTVQSWFADQTKPSRLGHKETFSPLAKM